MNILIDWDNMNRAECRKGVKYIVEKVLLAVAPGLPSLPRQVSVRLYGGWYKLSSLTKRAQLLATDIQQNFPTVLAVPTKSGPQQLSAAAELAYSLSASPNAHLFHTYRERRGPGPVRVDDTYQKGCGRIGCFALALHQLFDSKRCPNQGCSVMATDILTKHEQKLVDSMLGVDLVHAAATSTDTILVSEDDDLLPMVQYALLLGGRVLHVYPNSTRTLNSLYRPNLRGAYSCCSI